MSRIRNVGEARRAWITLGVAAFLLADGATAWAQSGFAVPSGDGKTRVSVARAPMNPDSPEGKAYAARQKKKVELERELNLIRVKYFGSIGKTEIRQAGISKLRGYTEAWMFPSLYSIFEREKDDVRGAILEQLAALKTDEADTTIAWAAVFGRDEGYRAIARTRLGERLRDAPATSERIQSVIAQGLASGQNESITVAAQLANQLNLVRAIPMLINAQVGSGSGGGGGDNGDPGTALADIVVGTQTAFVADLTPVVGDSAVAFDPKIGVLTEGVVLRVINATVIAYRVDVHNALVSLSSRAMGKPTDQLGWDNAKWRAWYEDELKPELARRAEASIAPPPPR